MQITHTDTNVFKTTFLTFDIDGEEYKSIYIENVSDDNFCIAAPNDEEMEEDHPLYAPIKAETERILNVKID
jgi:hypothetical protein